MHYPSTSEQLVVTMRLIDNRVAIGESGNISRRFCHVLEELISCSSNSDNMSLNVVPLTAIYFVSAMSLGTGEYAYIRGTSSPEEHRKSIVAASMAKEK